MKSHPFSSFRKDLRPSQIPSTTFQALDGRPGPARNFHSRKNKAASTASPTKAMIINFFHASDEPNIPPPARVLNCPHISGTSTTAISATMAMSQALSATTVPRTLS